MMNYLQQVAQRNLRNQKSLMIVMKVWTKTIKKRDNRHQRSLPYCRTRYTRFISKMHFIIIITDLSVWNAVLVLKSHVLYM